MTEVNSNNKVKRYKTNPNFLLREIGDEYILIPIGDASILSNSVMTLNDTCQFLWKEFQTSRTIDEVIINARKVYNDPNGVLEQGVYQFVREYLQVGLLMIEEE